MDKLEVARTASNLGTLYRRDGRVEDAEKMYQRALDLVTNVRGLDDPATATCLHNLGELYEYEHRYADAELALESARKIREKHVPDSAELAQTLSNLGLLYARRGELARAEPFFDRAMSIDSKLFGPKDPRVADDLSNWGMLRWKRGDYKEAEAMLQKVLEIQEGALGPNDPALVPTLDGLATLYTETGRPSLATPFQERLTRLRN